MNTSNYALYQYCILKVNTKLFSSRIEFELDLGEDSATLATYNEAINQKTQQVQKYSHLVDGLNYLATLGWEIVNVYYREFSGTTYNNPQYLLKRLVSDKA
ncbi:hypothetical protein ABDD95_10420 [Mucilaginibacter sp. PAMB04274]|uniref:hypothetical protein n=1 Tax=Mucilaginibacter sp. PAMB04274 TaxID=3138568 RepID=UPI0031F620B4